MNDKTTEKIENENGYKRPLIITGLIGVVILIAWAAVQIVNVFPNAITSIASLADSVYNYNPKKDETLTLNTDRNIMNSGETIFVSWEKQRESNKYVFNYECADGISVDIKTTNNFESLSCDNPHDLGGTNKIELRVNSEKNRFSDLTYSVGTYEKDTNSPEQTTSETIALVNPNIINKTEEDTIDEASDVNRNPIEEPTDNNTPDVTVTENPATPAPAVATEMSYTYEIPVSNPNGMTDLIVSNINVGVIGFADTFIGNDFLLKNIDGATQFTIHNIGTRTSEDWTFETTLPGGVNYKSKTQEPLKPNERAIITVNFPPLTEENLQTIEVSIETKRDSNLANNHQEKTFVVMQ